jgi:hypothetical protein
MTDTSPVSPSVLRRAVLVFASVVALAALLYATWIAWAVTFIGVCGLFDSTCADSSETLLAAVFVLVGAGGCAGVAAAVGRRW